MACKKCKVKECAVVNCSNCAQPCDAIETSLIGALSFVSGIRESTGCVGYREAPNFICDNLKILADSQIIVEANSTHRFITADCELVSLPAATTFSETPITTFETPSLKLTPGVLGNGHTNFQGDVKVSATLGNQLSIIGDGLYVPAGASETSIVVVDTNSVNLTSSGTAGHTIQADVRLSTQAGNQIIENADGLYVPEAAAETPLTVNDGATIDFTVSGVSNHTLTGEVKISTTAGNRLSTDAGGLLVPQCTIAITSGTQQLVPVNVQSVSCGETIHFYSQSIDVSLTNQLGTAVELEITPSVQAGNSLVISGVDGKLYVPAGNTAVADTQSVNLTMTGSTITADVVISPDANNAIEIRTNGLFAEGLSETPLTVSDTASVVLVAGGLSNHTLSANVNISAVAGNAMQVLADGLYVSPGAETPLTVNDGATIDLVASGTANHTLTAEVKISANAGNIVSAVVDGIYASVPASAQTPITANNSTTINLTASGLDNHTLAADVNISATANNAIGTQPDGIYAFTGLVGVQTGFIQPDNASAIAALNTLTHPTGTLAMVTVAGVPSWFKYDGATWVFCF